MAAIQTLTFDEFVALLRQRLFDAEAIDNSTLPDFKELMSDYAEVIPDGWYDQAYEELEANGHLNPKLSGGTFGGGPFGRLSADGRLYVRDERGES